MCCLCQGTQIKCNSSNAFFFYFAQCSFCGSSKGQPCWSPPCTGNMSDLCLLCEHRSCFNHTAQIGLSRGPWTPYSRGTIQCMPWGRGWMPSPSPQKSGLVGQTGMTPLTLVTLVCMQSVDLVHCSMIGTKEGPHYFSWTWGLTVEQILYSGTLEYTFPGHQSLLPVLKACQWDWGDSRNIPSNVQKYLQSKWTHQPPL